jgi:hypothetical protein
MIFENPPPYGPDSVAVQTRKPWTYDDTPHIGEDAHKQWWTPWFLMGLTALTVGTFVVLAAAGVILR